jgi:protein TonB
VFNAEEPGITPPVAVRQNVPRVPSAITNQVRDRGLLELVIDEQGRVTSIELRIPLHPHYDAQLMSAARDWRYSPAMLEGRPVKFRKMIQIAVDKR